MDAAMIFFAKYLIFVIALLALIFLIRQIRTKPRRVLFITLFSLALAYSLFLCLSHVYFEPRPFASGHFTPLIPHIADNGFPSEHALLAFSLACVVFVFDKKAGLLLAALAALVGVGRVYAGLHSPLDIAVSFLISAFAASFVYVTNRRIERRRASRVMGISRGN